MSDDNLNDYNLRKSVTGEIMVNYPRYLITTYILYLCCKWNRKTVSKYVHIVE